MKHWLKSKLTPTEFIESDGVNYWREKIFLHIIFFLSLLGLIATIIGVAYSIKIEFYLIAIVDIIAYLYVLALFLFRIIQLKVRIYLSISVIYLFGMFLLLSTGPNGAGLIYIIGFVMLSAILLGLNAAYKSMGLLTLSTIFIYLMLKLQWFPLLEIHIYEPDQWIAVVINLLVIGSLTSIPLAVLVKQTKRLSSRQLELSKELVDQNIKLNKEREKAEQANQLKTEFLKNMNHEIRTPLNSIIGFSDLIKNNYAKNENEKLQFIKNINESGHDLLSIIHNILETSILDTSELRYKINSDTIGYILSDIRIHYEQRGLNHSLINFEIQSSTENDLLAITTDHNRVLQIMNSFISNAIKYTPCGDIKIGYRLKSTEIIFFVKDDGVGISKEFHDSIFDQFYKVANKNFLKEGVGLGLYIARRIANDLGGRVWVESEKDNGSCFYLSLKR